MRQLAPRSFWISAFARTANGGWGRGQWCSKNRERSPATAVFAESATSKNWGSSNIGEKLFFLFPRHIAERDSLRRRYPSCCDSVLTISNLRGFRADAPPRT